ncbi:Transmembrane protein 42 [Amphibalanus amphitrite]|uniref:Transmembrane protein 42 n=1 Tax=Amphibalanus amphitrite TaxID=1232801 RepID=A0A6A4X8Z8_AMPAM|nr:transmembrane protein 42-like isoform X1 [Amphibalanus amphitrite]XP_043246842.1 transmembrane protein 42-like isoform X1 [Amphibalanus amphitrite]XP_043246843.1 transmembrane protein 42-like isoform X1 [Amphibalanus amphitrite]KAF0292088.1 Transmembrane protein 42 [Amphibalanus amphitrite]KAF0313979.1 Transmembrane protein 42 [Amphibalanus amphitrite]
MQPMGVWHAAHAGLYAATAGLTGKFAASYSEAHWLCLVVSKFLMFSGAVQPQLGFCDERVTLFRVAMFVLTLLVNALLWTTFSKALRHSASSLEAIVITTASNMLITAVISQVLFSETLGVLWWSGLVLVVFGLALIHAGSVQLAQKRRKHR